MGQKEYKLERNELKAMTFEEADDHVTYWKNKTAAERLNAACFIINQIFGTNSFTKIDTQVTDKRKHLHA